MTAVSPEQRLLVDLALDAPAWSRLGLARVDWPLAFTLASARGFLDTMCMRLVTSDWKHSLPDDVLERVRDAHGEALIAEALLRADLALVAGSTRGQDVLVMKGGALLLRCDTRGGRHMDDLDLFVDSQGKERLVGALEAAGCRRLPAPERARSALVRPDDPRARRTCAMVTPRGTALDIHWENRPTRPMRAEWRSATRMDVGNGAMLVPSAARLARSLSRHALLHHMGHSELLLRHLADLTLLRRSGLELGLPALHSPALAASLALMAACAGRGTTVEHFAHAWLFPAGGVASGLSALSHGQRQLRLLRGFARDPFTWRQALFPGADYMQVHYGSEPAPRAYAARLITLPMRVARSLLSAGAPSN